MQKPILALITLLFALSLTSCKPQRSNLEAFSEDRKKNPDRIYLAIDDYKFVSKKRAFAGNTIDTLSKGQEDMFQPEVADSIIRRYRTYKKFDTTAKGKLHVIGCFNEPTNPEACVELPKNAPINPSSNKLNLALIHIQSPSSKKCRKGQINLNRRFRLRDFPLSADKSIKSLSNSYDYERNSKCVELFGRQTLLDTVDSYSGIAKAVGPKSGAYVRALMSGAGCVIGIGNALQIAETAGKAGRFAWGAKIAAAAQGKYGAVTKVLTKALLAAGKVDDILFNVFSKFKGSAATGRYANAMIGRLFTKLKGVTGGAILLGLKVSPRLSQVAIRSGLMTDERKKEFSYQTLGEELKNLQNLTPEARRDAAEADKEITRILKSDIYKQAISSTEKIGITTEDWVYMGLTAGSIFLPGVSCILLAKDIQNISNKKRAKNNLINLQEAVDQARFKTQEMFAKFAKDTNNSQITQNISSLKNEYKKYIKYFGKKNLINTVEFNNKNDDSYQHLAAYYQILNIYAAQMFNLHQAKGTFKHKTNWMFMNDGISAFETFQKNDAKSVQDLTNILAVVSTMKKAEELIISEVSSAMNNLNKDDLAMLDALSAE
jgi:hypothetical protein